MTTVFFSKQSDFRKWLLKNHKKERELLVGFYNVSCGKPSLTWSQSVDEALCFGWIDGVRRSIDKDSYSIRFTPRKTTSIWSAININKVEDLTRQGLMQPAGIESFNKKKENRSNIYSYENEAVKLASEFEQKFNANKKAWTFFRSQSPSYQKTAIHLIMNAKRGATKMSRLVELIADCEAERKMKRLSYGVKKYFFSNGINQKK